VEKNSCAFLQALGNPATDAQWPLSNCKCFFSQKNSVIIAFNVSKLNSHQHGGWMREQTPLQSAAEVWQAVSSFRPSASKLLAALLVFCRLQYCFVISELTGAQRGPGPFPLLPRPADRYQPGVGCPVYVPEQDLECWLVPPALSPSPVPVRHRAPRSAEAGLCVRTALRCICRACRGFCRSPAVTREIFSTPPPLHNLASAFLLLFFSSCLCSCWLQPGPSHGAGCAASPAVWTGK